MNTNRGDTASPGALPSRRVAGGVEPPSRVARTSFVDVTAGLMGDPGSTERRAPTPAEVNKSKPHGPTTHAAAATDRERALAMAVGERIHFTSYTRANHWQNYMRRHGMRGSVRTDYNGGAWLKRLG